MGEIQRSTVRSTGGGRSKFLCSQRSKKFLPLSSEWAEWDCGDHSPLSEGRFMKFLNNLGHVECSTSSFSDLDPGKVRMNT